MGLEDPRDTIISQGQGNEVRAAAESAAQESYQHMGRIIQEMKGNSRFQRERVSANQERISSPENGEFFIDRVTDPNTPETEEICKFVGKFDP